MRDGAPAEQSGAAVHRIQPSGGSDDAALVVAARAGDQSAMDELVTRYLPLLYNIVGRALDGDLDVDDVVQETLFRVVDRLRDLRDPAAFRSWMVAIAVRQVRDRWSARRSRSGWSGGSGSSGGSSGLGVAAGLPVEAADPGADFVDLTILRLELADQRRETALATRWLDEDDRELLALWWLEAAGQLTRAELVEALGLTPGHASVRVQRMKARLDAARTVVRALEAVPRCGELDAVAQRWDGRLSSAWRKQFARHVRECTVCCRHGEGLVAAERLLAGLALVPVPASLVARLTNAAGALGVRTKSHTRSHSRVHSTRTKHGNGNGNGNGNLTRHLAVHGSGKVVSVVAAAVVAVGAGAVYAVAHGTTRNAAAAVTVSPRPALTSLTTSAPTASATTSASASTSPRRTSSGTSLAADLTTTPLSLSASTAYLQPGYNELPQWRRIDTQAAPNGDVYVAWQASDGIHVSPLNTSGRRSGSDIVVSGAQEVSGLVALDDGFALLTRMPDTTTNMWGETAAWLVRYRADGGRVWAAKLTGAASDDTAPVLDGALRWNGTRFGAYFVVHGAGGFASGHYGDKLVYVSAGGAIQSGGWSWGCSHNEGIGLWPQNSGPFASLCYDDWRSGLFVSTGIGAPDDAPVVQRAQCWAGYCGGIPGGLTRTSGGRFAALFSSTGMAAQKLNPADSSGRGWTVTPQWHTHQIAVSFLNNDATAALGSPVYLTSDSSVDNVNPHIAPYGANGFLVSWESVAKASCDAGTCTGVFTGTHVRLIDTNGRFLTPDLVVPAHIAGDIAVLPGGGLVWAAPPATPSYAGPLAGAGPSARTLTIAALSVS